MRIKSTHIYYDIISLENLLQAWREFRVGKRKRKDVQEFEQDLMRNIISLHNDLATKTYYHGGYEAFKISDPKPRNIHKATVRDRLLHHAIYRILYPFFDRIFIADSYSCRLHKGSYKPLYRFCSFGHEISEGHTRTVWVLKCDISKFFASINQAALINIFKIYISDDDILWLLSQVIGSFYSTEPGVGLPLGNLTSQLLVNICMNKFDQFMKHRMKAKYYIRYADDFVVLSRDKDWLLEILPKVRDFLLEKLRLELHSEKIFIKTIHSGVDFLGWVHFSDHRVLRTATKRRMIKKLQTNKKPEVLASYLGLLKHGNTYKIKKNLNA